MKKKWLVMLSAVLCFAVILSACGGNNNSNSGTQASQSPKASDNGSVSEQPAKQTSVNFYGKIVEYSSGEPMVQKMQELLPELKITATQVDWANLLTVLKTAITAGNPPDVAVYWPNQIKPFVDANQAMDLTPYLEADNGAWKDSFVPSLLEQGKHNGKYYAVPIDANFSMLYVNADLFEKAGVEVPQSWTWDEFIAASKQLKDKAGVFSISIASELNDWFFRNGMLSLAASENKVEDVASGKIEATNDIFKTPLVKTKEFYDAGYWYPGAGALTTSRDEAKAAFMQGKVAMLGEVSALFGAITGEATFNVVGVEWPHIGDVDLFNGATDGLFIPINAPHPEEAVKMLKTFTGEQVQQIHADAGFITTNKNVSSSDPNVAKIAEFGKNSSSVEFANLSSKIKDYTLNQLTAEYIMGSGDAALEALEKLRQEAIQQ